MNFCTFRRLIFTKSTKLRACNIAKIGNCRTSGCSKIDFTQNLIDRKILNFTHHDPIFTHRFTYLENEEGASKLIHHLLLFSKISATLLLFGICMPFWHHLVTFWYQEKLLNFWIFVLEWWRKGGFLWRILMIVRHISHNFGMKIALADTQILKKKE